MSLICILSAAFAFYDRPSFREEQQSSARLHSGGPTHRRGDERLDPHAYLYRKTLRILRGFARIKQHLPGLGTLGARYRLIEVQISNSSAKMGSLPTQKGKRIRDP